MKTRTILFSLLFSITITILSAHALLGDNKDRPLFAPDKIKIQLTEEAYSRTDIPEVMYAEAESFQIRELDDLLAEIGVTKIIRAHRKVKDTIWEKQTGFDRWFLLSVPEGTDIQAAVVALKSSQFIEYANPEYYAYPDFIPNDLYYPYNWGHNNTAQFCCEPPGQGIGQVGFDSNAEAAWNNTQGMGSVSVIIAIIDSGADLTHPDLRLVAGYDFGDNDSNPSDDTYAYFQGHGTGCAGIAAAKGNNTIGVTGIAAGCSVMPLKVSSDSCTYGFSDTAVENALTYAADNGADVVSMSFGSINSEEPPSSDAALNYAHNQGLVLFASSGNDNMQTSIYYPSAHPHVITVGAASPCGQRKSTISCDSEYWWGSNWGPDIQDAPAAIDLMAPTILPTTDVMGAGGLTVNDYAMQFNGTSCASPYAAGVAALLLSKSPAMDNDIIRSVLTYTATDMTIDGGEGWDYWTGYGMVNAEAALAALPSIGTKIWTGAVSSNWNNPLNWDGGVPNVSYDAIIYPVSAGYFYPSIGSGQALCNNLHIGYGANLTVESYNLTIDGNLNAYGNLQVTGDVDVVVYGNISWDNGSTANMTHPNALLKVMGNMYVKAGSNINITNGTVEFSGTVGAGIYCNSTAHIFNLVNSKAPGVFGFADTSTHDFYIDGDFTNLGDRYFRNYSPQTIYLAGDFINGVNGVFYFDAGTLYFNGGAAQSIQNSSSLSCYFNHLKVAKTAGTTASMTSHITVYGSVSITSGIFNSNNHNIELQGNWYNTAGEDSFTEGDGAVICNGTADQELNNEHFCTLVLNKTSGELRIPAGSTVLCDKYTRTTGVLRVNGGSFTTSRIIEPGIYGIIYLESGLIDMRQDEYTRMDLNGILNISGGTFIISGGSTSDNIWGYDSPEAKVLISGGVCDFFNQSILLTNPASNIVIGASGGTIRTNKAYICTLSNINFNGGTLEFYGLGENYLEVNSSCHLFDLLINKGASRTGENRVTEVNQFKRGGRNDRLDGVILNSDVTMLGTLEILQGEFVTGNWNVTAHYSITVAGTLRKTGGTLFTYGDFIWQDGGVSDITGGSISYGHNWEFNTGCTVSLANCPVTFIGNQVSYITHTSSNGSFGAFTFNGNPTDYPCVEIYISANTTSTLTFSGLLTINNANHFYLNGRNINCNNNITLYGTSKLSLGAGSILRFTSGKILNVNTGATLEVLGENGQPAKISHFITGTYTLNINSGATIAARYAIFEYMNSSGVNVKNGALVSTTHPFDYCTFQYGTSTGALLTIDNSQTVNIYGAYFPTRAASTAYSVKKNLDQGTVNFYNAIGTYAGDDYESGYGDRINWQDMVQCDLVANDISAGDTFFYVCEPVQIDAGVVNNSANQTYVPVRVDLYYNRTTAPVLYETGDQHGYLNPLGAYEMEVYDFEPASSEVPGTWNIWLQVDALNEISETNESNNIMSVDDEVTWLALPVVQNLTIVYNEITEQVELAWAYPPEPEINCFKVYRSDNPYGPFDTLVGTPAGTFFSPLTTGHKYFYQVRAEKTWQ